MRADLNLKQKQAFWETPRNLVIIIGAVSAVVATVAGFAGYKIGSQPAGVAPSIVFQPGSIVVSPSPAPAPAIK